MDAIGLKVNHRALASKIATGGFSGFVSSGHGAAKTQAIMQSALRERISEPRWALGRSVALIEPMARSVEFREMGPYPFPKCQHRLRH